MEFIEMFTCCWQKMTWHSRRFHSECMTVKYCATSPSEINGVTLATPPCCVGKLSEVQLKYFLHSGRTGSWTFLMQLWSYVLTNVTISDGHVFTLYHDKIMKMCCDDNLKLWYVYWGTSKCTFKIKGSKFYTVCTYSKS